MKIAYVLYTSGFVSGGAAKHFHDLPPLIAADPRVTDLQLFIPEGAVSDYPADLHVVEWKTTLGGKGNEALRTALAAYNPDVVFIPSARFIKTPDTPTVIMVRNMEPLRTPFAGNTLVDRAKNIGRLFAARRACHEADRIIAVSDHVRDWLLDNWRVPAERIGTVPHGVERPPHPHRPKRLPDLTGRRFIFSAGSIRPARGLTDLIWAMEDERFPKDLDLVFAGMAHSGSKGFERRILARLDETGLAGRVHWLGQCNSAEISWGFRNCDLFVMTSRAEACPNTVLEALSHGCLSVSCDTEPMPEFFANAALYYRSGNPSSLAERIVEAMALPHEQADRFRQCATERAAAFTWEKCAERTVDELLATLGTSVRG